MGKGVPKAHYQFLDEKGVLGLYQVYLALTVTLECIEEALFLDVAEQRVFKYLRQYVSRMKVEEIQHFCGFVQEVQYALVPHEGAFLGLSGVQLLTHVTAKWNCHDHTQVSRILLMSLQLSSPRKIMAGRWMVFSKVHTKL